MLRSIINTKIMLPPSNPSNIRRERLITLLNKSSNSRLIYIYAPAGYGKTSLVREWLYEKSENTAWFSIDSNDNDINQFFLYLLTSLQQVYPNVFNQLIGTINEAESVAIDRVAIALINKLSSLDQITRIVLDDYHLIENESIHDLISFFLDHLPKNTQIIITSRNAEPFSMHQWRVRNQLTEISTQDLLFTPAEIEAFIQNSSGLALSSADLQTIMSRTEGWITALQLLVLAMRTLPPEEVASDNLFNALSNSQRFILDYLNEEVVKQQTPDLRDFLLRTSILKRMSAPLCDSMLGSSNSDSVLKHLEAYNLFTIPLDGSRQWYRYHPLFAELLHNSLRHVYPSEISDLHIRASQWYANNGDFHEAITHALISGKHSEVIPLSESIILDSFSEGKPELSRNWLGLIPIEVVHKHPLLCLAQVQSICFLHPFDYDQMEYWSLQAKKADPALLEKPISHPGVPYQTVGAFVNAQIAWLNTLMARWRGKPPEVILQSADAALNLAAIDDYFMTSSLWMSISRAYLNLGLPPQAEQALQKAITLSKMSGDYSQISDAFWTQAYIAYWQGNFRKALNIYRMVEEQYLSPSASNGTYLSATTGIYTFWASVLREFNQLDEAETIFIKSQDLAQLRGMKDAVLDNQIGLSWICVYRNDWSVLRELEETIPSLPTKKANMVLSHLAKMRLYLAEKRPDLFNKAYYWLNKQHMQFRPLERLENDYLTWVQAALIQKRSAKINLDLHNELISLEKQYHFAESAHFLRTQVWIRVLQALIQLELKNKKEANRMMSEALFLAEPERYIRSFIDFGQSIIPLLQAARDNNTVPDYATELLRELHSASDGQNTASNNNSSPVLNRHLTPREKEILTCVAAGFSNQQIADKLVLSPGTVKKYLSSLYQKLNVHSRTQAVALAREISLL